MRQSGPLVGQFALSFVELFVQLSDMPELNLYMPVSRWAEVQELFVQVEEPIGIVPVETALIFVS